jgi:hypothetical protein
VLFAKQEDVTICFSRFPEKYHNKNDFMGYKALTVSSDIAFSLILDILTKLII